MATRPKLIQAGYTTLDSIPHIQKGSGTRFYCPALKGVDSKTQERVSKWIQLLHKHPAHLHALGIKDAQKQRDLGIKPLAGMTTSKLADKCIVKRNKIRNQCTLLRSQVEDRVVFFLDKVEETIRAGDNLLLNRRTHGTPLGYRKVKETMYKTVGRILEEIEQWRENSSTDDTLTSLTYATAINRQCPTCNRLWTTEQFPPSLAQCLTCSKMGTKKKPSKFKLQDNQVGLIFRSALPEELEWETRAEDVALSLDAIKRCLSNMLTALDRETPQTKNGLAPHINFPIQEIKITQEPP